MVAIGPGPGRPRLGLSPSVILQVRVPEEEKDRLDKIVERDKVCLSELLRSAIAAIR